MCCLYTLVKTRCEMNSVWEAENKYVLVIVVCEVMVTRQPPSYRLRETSFYVCFVCALATMSI